MEVDRIRADWLISNLVKLNDYECRKPRRERGFQVNLGLVRDTGAEEVGFEPTEPETGSPVFETGPFNHSGTPPGVVHRLIVARGRTWRSERRILPRGHCQSVL